MAETTDIELTVGAIADVAQVNKVGQQIRAQLQKYVMESLDAINLGSTRVSGYLSRAVSGATGTDIYSALRHARNEVSEIRTRVRNFNKKNEISDPVEAQVLDSVIDTLNVATNVSKRTAVYSPINTRISEKKAKAKAAQKAQEDALKAEAKQQENDEKVAASELAKWEQQQAAKALEQAKLVQYLNGYDVKSSYVDYNKRADIAAAFQEADDAEKEKRQQEKDALKENTRALKSLTIIASGVVATGLRTVANILPTYWEEQVSRSFWGSKEAQVARAGAISKGGGEAIGAVLGGVIGSFFGPGGTLVGSGIGANIGGTVGGLYGTFKEKELQAVKKTVNQVNSRYRSYGIYGGQASVGYAQSIEDTGMASSGDMEKMVHNSATLGARMMFGQVGESEMLMYSLMPGYFAAAMSGASDAQLAEAYKNDIEKLPPQLRVWAAENVGGGSLGMLAYTQSPMWDSVQAHVGTFRAQDAAQMLAGKGYAVQSGWRAVINREKEYEEFGRDLSRSMKNPERGLWLSENPVYELAATSAYERKMAIAAAEQEYGGLAGIKGEEILRSVAQGPRNNVLQTINIVVDGDVVQSEENVITQEMMNGGYAPTLTSLLGVD